MTTSPTTTMPAQGTPTTTGPTAAVEPRYLAPDRLTRWVLNPIVAGLARLGVSLRGSRLLEVRGRTSGEWRAVPVNPLVVDGERFLVAPRGETQWVRNLRVAGAGRLRRGRTIEPFTAVEIVDGEKPPILRAYLDEWAFEVGKFFDGLTAESPDADLDAAARGFPVFRIIPA